MLGHPGPWTDDPVLSVHRFTNAFRASDRVSQYLIRHVASEGDPATEEVFFRIVLFKLFNRISTWEILKGSFGNLTAWDFNVDRYDQILSVAFDQGERLYSAAYIMPAASRDAVRKHRTHLELLRFMVDSGAPKSIASAASMKESYDLLLSFRGIGEFLAYQLAIDLNYSSLTDHSEMEFVKAGPGAKSGIRKCFSDTAGYSDEDIIRYVAERQADEFAARGLAFKDLWGRPLQLIDCQNLFCEVDKYARVVHPEVKGIGDRTRIKQRFQPQSRPIEIWFPPKWEINDRLPSTPRHRAVAQEGQLQFDQIAVR